MAGKFKFGLYNVLLDFFFSFKRESSVLLNMFFFIGKTKDNFIEGSLFMCVKGKYFVAPLIIACLHCKNVSRILS